MFLVTCIVAAQLAGAQAAPEDPLVSSTLAPVGQEQWDAAPVTAPHPSAPAPPAPPEPAKQDSVSPSVPVAEPVSPGEAQHGDIVVSGKARAAPGDPLQGLNTQSYKTVQAVDEVVTGPIALTYKKIVPNPIRSGLRNFLSNLSEPVVAINYLLQLKPGKSAETVGRFAINSTVGVAGLVDVAKKKPFKLPRRANGFGNTLGYYGVKPGPFLYLPLMGPTTVRDLVGRIADVSVLPVAVGQPFSDPMFAISTTTIRLIDERAEADEAMRKLLEGSKNPYATVREDYLHTRQAEIDALHGRGGADNFSGTDGAGDRPQRD